MCLRFYTRISDPTSVVKTANKDITVYKVVELRPDNTYRSQYVSFKYELGVRYKAGVDWPEGCVHTGHYDYEYGRYTQIIAHGFHSYDDLAHAELHLQESWLDSIQTYVMECHIPKGAKYIAGMNNDIISSEIIIDKQL